MGRVRRSARVAVAALLVATVSAGCDGSGSAAQDEPSEPGSSTASSSPSEPTSGPASPASSPTLDPAHAVERPGPRAGVVGYPDIVVTGSETIDARTIAAIKQKLPELGENSRILGFNYDTGERYLSVPDFLPES